MHPQSPGRRETRENTGREMKRSIQESREFDLTKALKREVHSSSVQFKVMEVKSFVAAHESLKDRYFSGAQTQIPGPH